MPARASKQDHAGAPGSRDVRGEQGFTLIELLVAMAMLAGIMTALVQVFTTSGPVAGRDQARNLGIMDAQVGLAQMTRDVRQAQTINSATSSGIDFNATIGGVAQRIRYDCSTTEAGTTYRQCLRADSTTLTAAPSLTGAKAVITRLQNSAVFAYSPNAAAPTYVAVHIEVPRDGGYEEQGVGYQNNIAFDGGVYLPNLGTQ